MSKKYHIHVHRHINIWTAVLTEVLSHGCSGAASSRPAVVAAGFKLSITAAGRHAMRERKPAGAVLPTEKTVSGGDASAQPTLKQKVATAPEISHHFCRTPSLQPQAPPRVPTDPEGARASK